MKHPVTGLDYEERRPGIDALMAEIRAQHPNKPELSVIAEAKELWHELNPVEA